MRPISTPLALLLLAAPLRAQTPKPGDLVVQSLSATNSVCVYRPDGTPVACSAGAPSDWWIGVALTPELGWVTTNLMSTGYELLRFDAHGYPTWQTGLPQLWQVPDLEVAPDGTLVLLDFPIESMQLYDLFGNHQATVPLGAGFGPNELEITPDGELWMASGPDVRRYDVAGNLLAQFALGFQPESMSLAADGSLWFVVAGSKKLRHRAADGTKLPGLASTGGGGALELAVDLTAIPTNPPSQVVAGETWHFQAWFRDANPGPTSNFADAWAVAFF